MIRSNIRSGYGTIIVTSLVVFIAALVLRLHPIESESFQYDAVVSQMAASRGIAANAMDRDNVFYERRAHPPLLSYIIIANNGLFGSDEFRARLFSIIAGSLCCLAVLLTVTRIMREFTYRHYVALFAALMVVFVPVNQYISKTANWDAAYSLLITCALLYASRYSVEGRFSHLITAGVFAVLAFLTCELALILVPVFLYVFIKDLAGKQVRYALRRWIVLVALSVLIVLVLWPAGVLHLNIFRMIKYRLYDSMEAQRNAPWYGFYVELFLQSPAFVVFAILGIAGLAATRFLGKNTDVETGRKINAVTVMMVPFIIYISVAFLISLRNRLVYVHHIADMMPPLAVISGSAIGLLGALTTRRGKIPVIVACLVLIALSVQSGVGSDRTATGPQEHPGFLGVRDYFANKPDARIYYYYAPIMEYYLPNGDFSGGAPKQWTETKIENVHAAGYDFIVTDWSMFSEVYPDILTLSKAIEGKYTLAKTVLHKRTDQPVAWIYARDAE